MQRRIATKSLFVAAAVCVLGTTLGAAAESPVVLFFFQDGCPDCELVDELLTALALDLPEGAVERHEISEREAGRLFRRLRTAYAVEVATVPMVFIGDQVISGSGRAQEFRLRDVVGRCATLGCPSPLERIAPQGFAWRDTLEVVLVAALLFLLARLQLS
ncbi:MAG: hypothetical protein AB1778_07850 [Candidatus Bipolaricaulota bacterium]